MAEPKKDGKTTNIDYIYLELIHDRGNKQDVMSGLFCGIKEFEGDEFILIAGLKNTVSAISTRYYNIMTIEVLKDEFKNMTYVTHEAQDQVDAMKKLVSHYEELKAAGYHVKEGSYLLDLKKYKDVPEAYSEIKTKSSTTTGGTGTKAQTPVNNAGNFAANQKRYQRNNTTFSQTPVTPDPEPRAWGRSGVKNRPSKAALELMIEKIEGIKSGEMQPVIPDLPEDDPDYDEQDLLNGYAHGCC